MLVWLLTFPGPPSIECMYSIHMIMQENHLIIVHFHQYSYVGTVSSTYEYKLQLPLVMETLKICVYAYHFIAIGWYVSPYVFISYNAL